MDSTTPLAPNEPMMALTVMKKKCRNLLSNISFNSKFSSEDIDNNRVRKFMNEGCVFFLHDKGDFFNVFFTALPDVDIIESLKVLKQTTSIDKPLVIEHIIRAGKDETIGEPNAVLKRMVHTGSFDWDYPKGNSDLIVKDATLNDTEPIQEIFSKYFNPLRERIPDGNEVKALIEKGSIKVIVSGDKIVGMIVFQKEGTSLHLRYWWIHPDFRGQGLGSRLMNAYFDASRDTTRQFLWVFSDNENAIKRYRHYGFDFDSTEDYIYEIL